MNNLKQLKQELLETRNKYEEIEKKIYELEKQRENSYERSRLFNGQLYYFSDSSGSINFDMENYTKTDDRRYEFGNYFETKEEAENLVEKFKVYTQLKDLALRLNNGEKINWSDSTQHKWGIVLDNFKNILRCYAYIGQEVGQIYCLDENFLKEAKQEIGEENLKKLFE